MLKILSLLGFGLALAPIAFAQSDDAGATMQTRDGVACAVRASKLPQGLRLTAVAKADRPLAGGYRFEVSTDGPAGTSRTSQSGDFALGAGEEAVLGEASVGAGDRADVSARLSLSWDGGEIACDGP